MIYNFEWNPGKTAYYQTRNTAVQTRVKAMREEYDFSKGQRGKFYSSDAQFNLPVYLEADVLDYFAAKAKAKGVALDVMVNDLLRKDIALIEGVNPI